VKWLLTVSLYGLALAASTLVSSAEVYRWVDSKGIVHFGDRAPREQHEKADRLAIKNTAAPADPEAERARQSFHRAEEDRKEKQQRDMQRAAEAQQQRARLAQQCKSVQNEIRYEQQAAMLVSYDDEGKRVGWTTEQRTAYKERLAAMQQHYCGANAN
jgi:hypothetical protein